MKPVLVGVRQLCVVALSAQLTLVSCAKKERPEEGLKDGIGKRSEVDLKALRSAAVGTWGGHWGQLRFNADGSASFSLRTSCDEGTEDCQAVETTGKLLVEPYRFALRSGDESNLFDAYLDAEGKIHVDVLLEERVTPVDEQRRGRIPLGMFRSLLIGSDCSLVDEFTAPSAVPCRFEKAENLTLLRYRVPPGTFVNDKQLDRTMIHLEREQLLVPPSIHRHVFERTH